MFTQPTNQGTLTNVFISEPTEGDFLSYTQGKWEATAIPTFGGIEVNPVDLTGDGTGMTPLELTPTGVTPGTYTYATVEVDDKGRIQTASSGTLPSTAVLYGSGFDGAITLNNFTLSRDGYFTNLTVTGTLNTAGYRLFVNGTLTNNGTITVSGGNASGSVAGTAGGGTGTILGGSAGGAGGAINGGGSNGAAAGNPAEGGTGGAGGTGTGSGGTFGAGGYRSGVVTANGADRVIYEAISALRCRDLAGNIVAGGSGGGGGKGGTSSAGGGGGGGAGVMVIAAKTLAGTGLYLAEGGQGGNSNGGGGSGGGGGGGIIIVVSENASSIAGYCSVTPGNEGLVNSGAGSPGTLGATGKLILIGP